MRCYCCNSKNTFIDEKTGRTYCYPCWDIITATIGEKEEEVEEEMYVSFEDCIEDTPDLS